VYEKNGSFGWEPSTGHEGKEERVNPKSGVYEKKGLFGWEVNEEDEKAKLRARPQQKRHQETEYQASSQNSDNEMPFTVKLAFFFGAVALVIWLIIQAVKITVMLAPIWLGTICVGAISGFFIAQLTFRRIPGEHLGNLPIVAVGKDEKSCRPFIDGRFIDYHIRFGSDGIWVLGATLLFALALVIWPMLTTPETTTVILLLVGVTAGAVFGTWLGMRVLRWRLENLLLAKLDSQVFKKRLAPGMSLVLATPLLIFLGMDWRQTLAGSRDGLHMGKTLGWFNDAPSVAPGIDTNTGTAGESINKFQSCVSPDGRYTGEIVEHSVNSRVLTIKNNGKSIIEESCMGYLLGIIWSPGGNYVAINERRGNCGDYLWILDLRNAKVLKAPDNDLWLKMKSHGISTLKAEAKRKWGADVVDYKDWGTAEEWMDSDTIVAKLMVSFRGGSISKDEKSTLEAFINIEVSEKGARLESASSQLATKGASATISKDGNTPPARTIADLRKAADGGDAKSQAMLGFDYLMGRDVPKNETVAVSLFRQAAKQGVAVAALNLGTCCFNGIGVPLDKAEGVKWFRQAADQGDAEAQMSLWQCFLKGEGVPKNDTEAIKWLSKAAEGNAIAKFTLGNCYAAGDGVPKDDAKAFQWWRKAAEQGHLQAQTNLGSCYGKGMGVPKDANEAVNWYRRAAEHEHAQAQFLLGACYSSGECVAKDDSEAVKWYSKSAEQGYAEAQFHIGLCYATGAGISADIFEAIKWWRKAADQGNAQAQANLGGCYGNGFGVSKDAKEAVKWYRMAADQGLSGPQYTLGSYYLRGEGLPKDYVLAYMWFNLSASSGDAPPAQARDTLGKNMRPEQIKEAQRMCRE
ncbi:MAG: SEL1-like repeat protein, partial [Deltaproteobacteria bacterium]